MALLFSVVESKFESQGISAYAVPTENEVMNIIIRANVTAKCQNFLFIPEHPSLNFNPLTFFPSEN